MKDPVVPAIFKDQVPEIFKDQVPETFRGQVPENEKYAFRVLVPETF